MELNIPQGEFSGLIFDCDGTLADTMPLHYIAWTEVLGRHGVHFNEDQFYSMGGIPTHKIVLMLNEQNGTALDPDAIVHEKESVFASRLEEVLPIKPVVEYAERHLGHLPMAVASGGLRHVVVRTLQVLGLEGLFPVVVTAEDVTHGKPAPDTFLLAAERLGVEPTKCLVFEDSPTGIEAADRAGMAHVHVDRFQIQH